MQELERLAEDLTPRYEVQGLLGRGGFGTVHRAIERATGRLVALKVLHGDVSLTGIQRFLREATLVAALDHPGIVRVHAVGRHLDRPCIVYELIDGSTLAGAKPPDPRRRIELVRDAARGVAHAHARGIVHRDLKPGNIMVDRLGRVKVADFGLALACAEEGQRLTKTGALVGTPEFMAPEMFMQGSSASTPRSDVWSLGVLLYRALTGRSPVEAGTLVELMARLQVGTVVPPRKLDRRIDRALEAVCLRALSLDPARRHPDAGAFADELDAALEGRTSHAQRGRLVLGAAAIVALAALGAAYVRRDAPEPATPSAGPASPPSAAATPTTATSAAPPAQPVPDRTLAPVTDAFEERWGLALDGARVLTGGGSELQVWDARTGEELRSWPVQALCGARWGTRPVVGTRDGRIWALDPGGGDLASVWEGSGSVARLAIALRAPRGVAMIKEPGREKRAVTFELGVAPPAAALELWSADGVSHVAISPEGDLAAVSLDSDDRGDHQSGAAVLLIPTRDPRQRRRVELPGEPEALRFAGEWLFVGTGLGQLLAIDLAQGRVDHELQGPTDSLVHAAAHHERIRCLAGADARLFSAGERYSGLEVGPASELQEWDLGTRGPVGPCALVRGLPRSLDLSPDGELLVLGTIGQGVLVRRIGR